MPGAAEDGAQAHRHILVVEDDGAILGMISSVLASSGLDVEQAADGPEALVQAARSAPDLIITDIKMPVMDGWRFLEEFRRLAGCAAVPVIVTSAAFGPPAGQQLGHLHVNAYVSKPFDIDVLLAAVERLLVTPSAVLEYADSGWQASPAGPRESEGLSITEDLLGRGDAGA